MGWTTPRRGQRRNGPRVLWARLARHMKAAFGYGDDDVMLWVDARENSWVMYRIREDGVMDLIGYGALDERGRPPKGWR